MSEKDVSLPTKLAFVIQLQTSSGASEVGHRGRVEHLASGRAMHFADEDELWAFVDSVLATECVPNRANRKDKQEIGMNVSSATKRPPLQEWTPDKGQVVERPDSFEKIE